MTRYQCESKRYKTSCSEAQVLDLKKREALNKALVDNFKVDEKKITYNNISSTVSSEMRKDAIIAVLIATVCMLIYIWLRFKDFRFASSAIIALLHDVLVVLAFYAIARVSVGNTFIACMLTIVGFQNIKRIVIFDRIREELKTGSRKDTIEDVVNRSITQTLTRSIYTSFTTFVMVATLYVLGVSFVKEFAAPLMVGVVGSILISLHHRCIVVCNEEEICEKIRKRQTR